MPKLLVVTTVSSTIRAFLLPFVRELRLDGWQVDALATGVSSDPVCVEEFDGVWDATWSRKLRDSKNFIDMPRRIRRLVADRGYDIVHVHTPIASFVTRFALRSMRRSSKVKVVYTAHGFHFGSHGRGMKNSAFLLAERLAGRWTDALVVINREDEKAALRHRIVQEDCLYYMPGIGVDTNRYTPESVQSGMVSSVRNELGVGQGTPLLLCVAEFIPRKRHSDIVKALAQTRRCDCHMVFAGSGPLMPHIRVLARQLRVDQRVHFLGRRDDIPVLMSASAAVVLVSQQEGLPRSLMEALSMERPIIGSDIRGIRELADGSGLAIPLGNTRCLAQAIDWMIDHPHEAAEMGKGGRVRMRNTYELSIVKEMQKDLYRDMLTKDVSRGGP